MKSKDDDQKKGVNTSRREFIKKTGTAVAGLLVAPFLKPSGVLAYRYRQDPAYLAKVAITDTRDTPADSYVYNDARGGVRQKVQYLFEQLGGVSDLFTSGKTVVIKLNFTGGSGNADNPKLNGLPPTEAMWTHPTVVRAVVELIIDSGVAPGDITLTESLGSGDSYSNAIFQDFVDIQQSLGCKLVDMSKGEFVDVPTGEDYFNYPALTMNKILTETDIYVSIPKLKQHAEAGYTGALKNQVGSVPQSEYTTDSIWYRRQALHNPDNGSSATFLPRSVCDLNAARPVHFSVVDGIKNSRGGEGVWNPHFTPYESHVLFAGKDPVATDSIGAQLMGQDCEAPKLQLPAENDYGDTECDNYLDLLHSKGVGTNQMNEIEVVGDGKSLITALPPETDNEIPEQFKLCANYPNPFNPSTMMVFYMPRNEHVTLTIYDMSGRKIETLVQGNVPAGEHRLQWTADGLASGMYLARMQTKDFTDTIKMLYQK